VLDSKIHKRVGKQRSAPAAGTAGERVRGRRVVVAYEVVEVLDVVLADEGIVEVRAGYVLIRRTCETGIIDVDARGSEVEELLGLDSA
jgi:hypothetical protein